LPMRLNLFVAKSGCASRRKADLLIKEGKVKVNGEVKSEPWFLVKEEDLVEISGKKIFPKNYVYLIFNKPRGVTTTCDDPFAKSKVVNFLPKKYKGVYPAGRLDKLSRGLLFFTNDGNLCYRLTHPKFGVEKEYLVFIEGFFKAEDLEKAKSWLDKGVIPSETVKNLLIKAGLSVSASL